MIANCVNPGITRTEITRHSIDKSFISRMIIGPALKAFMKTPMQGAQAVLQGALDPKLDGQCGRYYRYVSILLAKHVYLIDILAI